MLIMLAALIFAGLLIYAAASDIASYTIPNWVSIALAGIFLVVALFLGAPLIEIAWHYVFGFAVLAVGFFLFQAKVLGGGDAKLFAAAGIWTGPVAFLPFIAWTVVAGGLMAIALISARLLIKVTETNPPIVNRLLQKQNGIPYGLAILFGGLMAMPALLERLHSLTLP